MSKSKLSSWDKREKDTKASLAINKGKIKPLVPAYQTKKKGR